ncbi:MAG: TatD family hydrolase [Candidatus Nanopelagicales bacterium]
MSTRTPPPAPEPLPGPLVDSHCHLDICAADGGPSVEHAMAQAREVGITKVVQVGCDVPSSRWAADIAAANDDIWAAVALHPNEAPRLAANEGPAALAAAWTVIDELADLPAVRAIGETGMDFFRTGEEGRAIQEESFRRHIQIAQRVGKTLVVHDRDSHDDVIRILDDEGSPETVVLHCFSGDADFAKAAARRGWYCSFAGVVTFKNAVDLRAALVEVPADRLLVETDAPFLTPVPYRGKPNGPYLVPLTVRAMAEVRGESLDELIATIWDNSERAFGPL